MLQVQGQTLHTVVDAAAMAGVYRANTKGTLPLGQNIASGVDCHALEPLSIVLDSRVLVTMRDDLPVAEVDDEQIEIALLRSIALLRLASDLFAVNIGQRHDGSIRVDRVQSARSVASFAPEIGSTGKMQRLGRARRGVFGACQRVDPSR